MGSQGEQLQSISGETQSIRESTLKLCQHLKEKEIERMKIRYFIFNVLTVRKVGRLHSPTSAND